MSYFLGEGRPGEEEEVQGGDPRLQPVHQKVSWHQHWMITKNKENIRAYWVYKLLLPNIRAYQVYKTAMAQGEDGRPDFAARKACNYLQDSVEVGIEMESKCQFFSEREYY